MKKNNRETGSLYEQMAVNYLKQKGYVIVEKNYRCRIGEIDIIARHKGYLVFIEVKYRKNLYSGMPAEAVNDKKQRVISKVARWYMMQQRIPIDEPVRFDIVSILGTQLTIFTNAFEYRG